MSLLDRFKKKEKLVDENTKLIGDIARLEAFFPNDAKLPNLRSRQAAVQKELAFIQHRRPGWFARIFSTRPKPRGDRK